MSYYGENFPKLGFGLMRMPTLPGGKDVDIEQVKKMVDIYMENGYYYFDTAFMYHGGASETAFREAVARRYPREKFHITDKMPLWDIKGPEDYERSFAQQLEKCGVEYFDLYFLHGIGTDRLKLLDETGGWDFLKKVKERGQVKHIGFSFHSPADTLEKILDAHPEVEVVQLQVNYYDWESESVQARKCWESARRHGIGVIIMEPIRGGSLASMAPDIEKLFLNKNPDVSVASWALRWCASLEGIVTVLSGMSNIAQMEDNIKTMKSFKPLTDDERAVIDDVIKALKAQPTIDCTACKYCVNDCPQHINTPGIFSSFNEYKIFKNLNNTRFGYSMATSKGGKAKDCIECGSCENHCPQNLPIIELLKEAAELYDK